MRRVLIVAVLSLAAAVAAHGWAAQTSTDTPSIDLKSAEAIAEGKRLYAMRCSHYCHGKEGRRGIGPALRGRDLDPAYLYNRIANGFRPMPAWKSTYTPEQIWDIVAYIESLKDAKD